jgi:hypothetical protein
MLIKKKTESEYNFYSEMYNQFYIRQEFVALVTIMILNPICSEMILNHHPIKRLRNNGKDIRWTFHFSGLPNDPQSVMIDRVQDSNIMMDNLVPSSGDDTMSMRIPSSSPTSVSFEPSTIRSFEPTTNFPFPTSTPTSSPFVSLTPSNSSPTFSPTLICGKTAAQRRDEIFNQVTDALGTNSFVLFNVTSPQSRALNWLLNERNETTCPGSKLLQRWVLATMYYSTGGDQWFQCSRRRLGANDNCGSETPFVGKKRFLSEDNECLWAGITCDVEKCVTQIEFGTYQYRCQWYLNGVQ